MRRLMTITPLMLALVLGGLSVPCGAQVRQPTNVQPAQKPAREIQRDVQKVGPSQQGVTPGGKSPSQSGPGTNELPTNRGINMGTSAVPGSNPAAKFPGAGGAATNQPSGQTTPALPASTNPLADRTKNTGPETFLGDKGTKVGPEYFSKEQQLKDLTDPKSGMKDAGPGGTEGNNPPGRKSGQDLLGGVPTTVTPGAGKDTSSRREQVSRSREAEAARVEHEAKAKADHVHDSQGNDLGTRGELERSGKEQWTGGQTEKELNAAATEGNAGITTTEEAEKRKAQQEKEPKWSPKSKDDGKKTPNPETDTGGGHVPKGMFTDSSKQPKSPSEMEAERKRQVTLPGEGRSQPERVYMSPEDALKGGISKSTDGRIDPADPNAATPTGSGHSTTPRPGFGPERVDGRVGQPHFQGGTLVTPQVAPAWPGNTPDNPTASPAPTTSTDRNSGGTTGDASRNP